MVLSCRATSNHKVKETVALELSYVNSNLQLLKEELEELNSSVDVYQNDRYTWQAAAFAVGRAACSAGILFSLLLFCFFLFLGARQPLASYPSLFLPALHRV